MDDAEDVVSSDVSVRVYLASFAAHAAEFIERALIATARERTEAQRRSH